MTSPLVQSHIDLRDFPYMPLDVVRLRDSDLSALASAEGFRAAVMLWCAAWHQVPAASLPNDDRMLANLSGFGRDVKGFKSIKSEALRNFVECDDGRLYHPVIAGIALHSWEAKFRRQAKLIRRLEMESGERDRIRFLTFKRDNFACQYCGAIGVRLECDHVIPMSRGGLTSPENLKTSCKPCNRSKGAKLLAQWRH